MRATPIIGVLLLLTLPRAPVCAEPAQWSGYGKAFLSMTDTEGDSRYDQADRFRLRVMDRVSESWAWSAEYESRARWSEEKLNSGRARARARFMDLERAYEFGDQVSFLHGMDRLWARYEPDESLQFTIGRQAVSWGTGLIWSPVDMFAAFAPNEIDREEKAGVDVVRMIWSAPGGGSLDLVGEPLDLHETWSASKKDSSVALRGGWHAGEFDLHAYAGQIQSDLAAGIDFAGYAGDAGIHGELLRTWVDETVERDYLRGVVGVDYGFAAAWNPYLLVEYFYNGLGEVDPASYPDRINDPSVMRVFERGIAYNIGRDYLGMTLRVQPSALVALSATALANLNDESVRQLASATWSVAQDLDVIAGIDVGLGKSPGEFTGTENMAVPDLYYLYAKYYF